MHSNSYGDCAEHGTMWRVEKRKTGVRIIERVVGVRNGLETHLITMFGEWCSTGSDLCLSPGNFVG